MSPETIDRYYIDSALKAQQWEIAKGHLRALIALQGSYSTVSVKEYPADWEKLEERVNAFISDIEDHGLQE